jgi:hypothetical protein
MRRHDDYKPPPLPPPAGDGVDRATFVRHVHIADSVREFSPDVVEVSRTLWVVRVGARRVPGRRWIDAAPSGAGGNTGNCRE